MRSDQVTQVRGFADQMLRVKNNPYDPSNRRITILVKNSRTTRRRRNWRTPRSSMEGGRGQFQAPARGRSCRKHRARQQLGERFGNAGCKFSKAACGSGSGETTCRQPAAKPGIMGKPTLLPGSEK